MIEPIVVQDSRTGEVKFWAGEEAQAYAEWVVATIAYNNLRDEYEFGNGPYPGQAPIKPVPTSSVTRSEALLLAAKLLVGPEGCTGPMGPMGMHGAPA